MLLSKEQIRRSLSRSNTTLVKPLKRTFFLICRPSVLLSEDKKSASIVGPDEIGGLVFIDGEGDSTVRKISLKIASSVS